MNARVLSPGQRLGKLKPTVIWCKSEGAALSDPSQYQPVDLPPPQNPPAQAPYVQAPPAQSGLSDSSASGLAYFFVIPAVIFLIVPPYNQSAIVRFHSWQSIFLAFGWIVGNMALRILHHIPILGWSTWLFWPLFYLGFLILWIIVMINAFNGKKFMIPVIGDLAEKQANG